MKLKAWGSFPYELKVTTGHTLPFSKFEPQQLLALKKAKHGILHHKMTDMSLGMKPCDAFVYKNSEAYIGILFHSRDIKQRVAYFLDIDRVYKIKESGARSISVMDGLKYGKFINIK